MRLSTFLLLAVLAADVVCVKAQDYDGAWTGTTAQNRSFSFNIQNGAISNFTYSIQVTCPTFTQTRTSTIRFDVTVVLSGPNFNISAPTALPGEASSTFNGTLASSSTAHGTLDVQVNAPAPGGQGCVAQVATTWTATKAVRALSTQFIWTNDSTWQTTIWKIDGARTQLQRKWWWILRTGMPGWKIVAMADMNRDGQRILSGRTM